MENQTAVTARGVEILALEDFLKVMEVKPQLFGWDALLVFDKQATNVLLTQEYIERLDVPDKFFPKLPDGVVDAGNGIEHVLLGLQLDKARLSFENADLKGSAAKLGMRVVAGKHLEVMEVYHDGEPVRAVQALTVYSTATHGLLDMNINLRAVDGTVDTNGGVLLDIQDAYDHRFSGGGTGSEKIRLGLYFDAVFESWNEDGSNRLKFPLSELVVDNNSPINPKEFVLLTHAPDSAKVRGSEKYGDGAVVVFISFGGGKGTLPPDNKSLVYMLPDAPEPYTSNLLLSHKFIAQQVVSLGLNQFDWVRGKFDVVELAGGRYKLVANAAGGDGYTDYKFYDEGHGGTTQRWSWKLSIDGALTHIFNSGNEIVFEGRSIKARWGYAGQAATLVYWIQTGDAAGRTRSLAVNTEVRIDAEYKFVVSGQGGGATLKFQKTSYTSEVNVSVQDDFGSGGGADDARAKSKALIEPLKAALRSMLQGKVDSLENMTFEIDALRLNNLLFRGETVVEPRDAALPLDLTLLGNLASKQTTLTVNPSEVIVASGQPFEFKAESAPGDVTWTVKNLPGETGDTGKFNDPKKGIYTAPSDAALLTEGQRRLIVTATSGAFVSRALVSVVPSHVTVNPWVAAVNVGRGHALSAGTPDSSALVWDTPQLGTVAPDDDPLNLGGYKYSAPAQLPRREATDPQYYRSLRMDPVTVRAAAGGAPATIDMLVVGVKDPNYWLEPNANGDGSVELKFYRINMDLEKVEVTGEVEWTVVRGSGTINKDTRVFTPTPGANDQYVIIAAYWVNDFVPGTCDYVILPMPYTSVRKSAERLYPENEKAGDIWKAI
ncbi:hypothetical protein [Pseudomonas rustica]